MYDYLYYLGEEGTVFMMFVCVGNMDPCSGDGLSDLLANTFSVLHNKTVITGLDITLKCTYFLPNFSISVD